MLVLSGVAWGQQTEPYTTDGQEGGIWMPHGSSTYTAEIDNLYDFIFYVTGGMFILVESLIIIFCIVAEFKLNI